MTIKSVTETEHLALSQDDLRKKLNRIALVVPAIILLMSAVAMTFEPRFGLFGVALLFGWTQLVGL